MSTAPGQSVQLKYGPSDKRVALTSPVLLACLAVAETDVPEGVLTYLQGGTDCLNLDLHEDLIKMVLCVWFRGVRPHALDFTRTTFYICRTETSSVKIGNYDTVRAMQAIFIYSLQNGNLAYSLLAISDG